MDLLSDVGELIQMSFQISPAPPEISLPEFVSANDPTEEYQAHNQSVLLESWLHTMKSTSRRNRQRMRATNPLFIADNPHGQFK